MKDKKQKGAKMVLPGWFASYADMVTVLMVFFILMFAMSNLDEVLFDEFIEGFQGRHHGRGTGESIFQDPSLFPHEPPMYVDVLPPEPTIDGYMPVDPPPPTVAEIAAEMADAFRTYLAPYYQLNLPAPHPPELGIEIPPGAEYVRLIMYDRAHFASGQAVLLADAIELIDRMSPLILHYAEQGHRVVIEGHADNVPLPAGNPFIDNWGLSAMRALSVHRHLVYNWGVPREMVSAVPFGDTMPIDTNDTPEGRANNRRVEIRLYTVAQPEALIRPPAGGGVFTIPGL